MTWAWLALVSHGDVAVPPDLTTTAGHGRLMAWAAGHRPHPEAVRIDAAILDQRGEAATLVWQFFPAGAAPLFDDPAIQMLTRRLGGGDLSGRRPEAVTTFTRDPVSYVGGLTLHRDARPPAELARDSWLRRVGRVETLEVAAGIFGVAPARSGPGTQRYAGQPWPATGFAGQPSDWADLGHSADADRPKRQS